MLGRGRAGPPALRDGPEMFRIRERDAEDSAEVEFLLDLAFAPGRTALSSYRLREGVEPVARLSLVARDEYDVLAGAIRYWPVRVGAAGAPALLLGPVAVHPTRQGEGLGALLISESLHRAMGLGWTRVILVGDEPYYRPCSALPARRRGRSSTRRRPTRTGCWRGRWSRAPSTASGAWCANGRQQSRVKPVRGCVRRCRRSSRAGCRGRGRSRRRSRRSPGRRRGGGRGRRRRDRWWRRARPGAGLSALVSTTWKVTAERSSRSMISASTALTPCRASISRKARRSVGRPAR